MAPPSTCRKHSSVARKPPGLHKNRAKVRVVYASADVSTEDEHFTIVEITLPTVEGATSTTDATDLTLTSRAPPAPTVVQPATRQVLPSKRTSNRASKTTSQQKAKAVAVAEAEKNGQRPEDDADCALDAECGDGGADGEDGHVTSKTRKKRVPYSMNEDCMVIAENITPDGLRKHIEKLEKVYGKAANADRALSGREPKQTADQEELEALMRRYVKHKENEDLEKAERKESKRKKTETDRIGGAAIGDAALSVERPHKMKETRKKSDPFAFLKELSESCENRRKEEARERSDRDVKVQLQFAEFQAQQSENLLQVAQIITDALQKPVLPGSETENN
ncbi:hypothetical protein PHPALM_3705 [Phytophthora palmivora]|uniref:Uncharacterized protein n=1 Tax=Phytophthora palmivora TaxID=4796 RepID=A0A2P4YLP8_9STRA|nr:hypothetical protein PHPALM_3705 [Phytophthora palmivora]